MEGLGFRVSFFATRLAGFRVEGCLGFWGLLLHLGLQTLTQSLKPPDQGFGAKVLGFEVLLLLLWGSGFRVELHFRLG